MDACLAQIPAETPEVAPLVEIAIALRSLGGPVPEIDAQARQQARSRFLSHAKALSDPSSLPIEHALDESIAKLATGASIDECLDAYPHHAAQLGALLDVYKRQSPASPCGVSLSGSPPGLTTL